MSPRSWCSCPSHHQASLPSSPSSIADELLIIDSSEITSCSPQLLVAATKSLTLASRSQRGRAGKARGKTQKRKTEAPPVGLDFVVVTATSDSESDWTNRLKTETCVLLVLIVPRSSQEVCARARSVYIEVVADSVSWSTTRRRLLAVFAVLFSPELVTRAYSITSTECARGF